MKAKEVTDVDIGDREVHAWTKSEAAKHIRMERLRDWISKVFEPVESRDQCVEIVVMDAADYSEMKKYLHREMDVETKASVMRTGQMATYCGVRVLVDREAVDAVAYGPVPDGTMRVMLEK